jgi:peroxiredoxin Q/BCP
MRALTLGLALALAPVLSATSACSTTSSLQLIAPGATAPDFRAPDQTGAMRTLAEFKGRPLVVFFYPKDGTPGCTKEACAFRDAWQSYQERGIGIVGVSADDVASHARFADEHKLPFPLLADVDGAVARAFGVDTKFGMMERVTVLVDKDGVVQQTWPDVDPGVHAAQILAVAAPAPTPAPASPSPAAPSP